MRIIILTKRQYMGKDLLDDSYGRFYEIPEEIANAGHDVLGICLSYRKRDHGWIRQDGDDRVKWYSHNLFQWGMPGFINYFQIVTALAGNFRPDLIYACSDSINVIFGKRLADACCVPYVVDLYDNYESYGISKIPGILSLFRKAARQADGVACISQGLADYVLTKYHAVGKVVVIENGVPDGMFVPHAKDKCRNRMSLPKDVKIIGTAGALHRNRGIENLYRAYEQLARKDNELHLVLAGPHDAAIPLPAGTNVSYLGELQYEEIPILFNALDVVIVCNRDSAFGRYCFPQKAYEIMGCGVPLVAAAVGSMKMLLTEFPRCLFKPDNPEDLAEKIESQLKNPIMPDIEIPTWRTQAVKLENLFRGIVDDKLANM